MTIISNRVRRLRKVLEQTMGEKKKWWGLDLTIMDKKGIEKNSFIVRKALAIEKLLMEMPIEIKKDELILGDFLYGSVGLGKVFPQYLTKKEQKWGLEHHVTIKSVWGHSCPNYNFIIKSGFSGLRSKIDQKLTELEGDNLASDKRDFLESLKISFDAVNNWSNKYAEIAQDKARIESGKRRKELLKIADICKKVPEEPAENFYEAIQSFMFIFIALQNCQNYVPIGRLDRMLYPYLEEGLKEGRITIEKAQELIDCLWMKFNERIDINIQKPGHFENHTDPGDFSLGLNRVRKLTPIPLANQWHQEVVLGGVNEEGNDATNLVTYMCLESTHRLKLIQPLLEIRISKKSPDKFLEKCAMMVQDGIALTIFNDEVVIKVLVNDRHLPIEIARNYASDGCWEFIVPGITEFRYTTFETLQLLEFTLNRGCSRISRKQEGLDLGDPLKWNSFEEVLTKYKNQLDYAVKMLINKARRAYLYCSKIAPTPLMSALMDGCIEKAQDITQGAAYEVIWSPMMTGIADAADSLAMIKKHIFGEKRFTMKDLLEALDNNFPDEAMRQEMINCVPKYGNNIDYVDEIAKELLNYIIERIKHYENYDSRNNNIKISFAPGVGTFEKYKACGELVGATPNGRRAQDAIAVNMTHEAGMNKNGITDALKSFVKLPLEKLTAGSPIDLTISQSSLGKEGFKSIKALMKSSIDMGVSLMSLKVNDINTLYHAQKEPEKFKDLTVRMGGWQAYFVTLGKKHQDHHIRRVKGGFI